MKIIQATITYPPAIGGADEYVRQISERLTKRGHNVQVYTSDLRQHIHFIKLKDKRKEINGVKIVRCWSFHPPRLAYPIMPSFPLKMLGERVDLIHGYCFWYYPAAVAAIMAKIKKAPFVLTPIFNEKDSYLWNSYKATLGRMLMNADVVVTISEFEKRLIEGSGLRVRRFEMVSPGIDPSEYESVEYNIYEKYGIGNKRVILFVGRFAQGKGIDVLLKAIPIILKEEPETTTFLIGPDYGEKSSLIELAKKLKVDKKVIFTENFSRPDLVSAYKNATVFVLPSRYEVFGMVLIEAMMGGIPVVATNYSAIPYVIEDGKTGFLFPLDDHKALAKSVIKLLKDEDLRKKMGEAGKEEVKQKYTWEKNIDKLEKIYEDLLVRRTR